MKTEQTYYRVEHLYDVGKVGEPNFIWTAAEGARERHQAPDTAETKARKLELNRFRAGLRVVRVVETIEIEPVLHIAGKTDPD